MRFFLFLINYLKRRRIDKIKIGGFAHPANPPLAAPLSNLLGGQLLYPVD